MRKNMICGKVLITVDGRKEEEMGNNQEEEVQNSVDRIYGLLTINNLP